MLNFFPVLRLTRVLACVLALSWAAAAPGPAPSIEVMNLRTNHVRPANGGPAWLETTLALNVRPTGGGPSPVVSAVRVVLLMVFELPGPAGGPRRAQVYASAVECVALEPGRTEVRFYLPPEVLKRDQIRTDPRFWGVELTAGGEALPAARTAYSANLGTPAARTEFQRRWAAAAAANDGILQPQHLTPFALEYPRSTPSVVRREPR
ncbi:MAG: hypothetical protein B9S27_04395 [Opitutia bacterium Tous-C8FEB]|nr:MAG: hypothetical protein B9S27_04395 [Opitutae bacterium Tous-C8FEB]